MKRRSMNAAAALHAGAQRAAHVEHMTVRMRREPAGAHLGERQHEPFHRLLGGGDLGRGHLREVFLLQHLAFGHGHARVELDLLLFLELVFHAGEQRVMHAGGAGLRRARRIRRLRQHHRHELIDIAAAAEKDAERLIEDDRVLVALHEHRMQRPVEILARAEAGGLHRLERIEHRAGADRNAGGAQRAGEVDDIFGEPAGCFSVLRSRGRSARRSRDGRGSVVHAYATLIATLPGPRTYPHRRAARAQPLPRKRGREKAGRTARSSITPPRAAPTSPRRAFP